MVVSGQPSRLDGCGTCAFLCYYHCHPRLIHGKVMTSRDVLCRASFPVRNSGIFAPVAPQRVRCSLIPQGKWQSSSRWDWLVDIWYGDRSPVLDCPTCNVERLLCKLGCGASVQKMFAVFASAVRGLEQIQSFLQWLLPRILPLPCSFCSYFYPSSIPPQDLMQWMGRSSEDASNWGQKLGQKH